MIQELNRQVENISFMTESSTGANTHLSAGFRIGDWTVKPLGGVFDQGDHQVHVEPKVMDVLVSLAAHQGEVVTRETLLKEVWGSVIVTDDVLTRCISELRTLLRDTSRERQYIHTVPKRGYRLIAPVLPLAVASGHSDATGPSVDPHAELQATEPGGLLQQLRQSTRSGRGVVGFSIVAVAAGVLILGGIVMMGGEKASVSVTSGAPQVEDTEMSFDAGDDADTIGSEQAGSVDSVAVLPFLNFSGNPEHEYFSDGLSEDIRNALLTATNIRVAARTSSYAFKGKAMDIRQIGRQLNVDALLEGTVRISADRLRITVQLTDARNGYPIWADSFERDADNKIQLQTDVAEAIVTRLEPSLSGREGLIKTATANVKAHEYYLLGRHHWHQRTAESLRQAIAYFERAIELDPEFALAYSGMADALLFQISYAEMMPADMTPAALEYAEKALALDPALGEAYASLGLVYEHTDQLEQARDAYVRAVELNPRYSMAQMWLGNSWLHMQDVNQAFEHYSAALELDPLHPTVQHNYVLALGLRGEYARADRAVEHFYRFNPNEMLLKDKLWFDLERGHYNRVLSSAVGHTFSREFKPYISQPLIEALIRLGRYDEARRMIDDNAAEMDAWVRVLLQASMAIAQRQVPQLREEADALKRLATEASLERKRACDVYQADYWRGLADFMDGDYASANQHFQILGNLDLFQPHCDELMVVIKVSALNYRAAGQLKMGSDAQVVRGLLSQAGELTARLRQRGWGMASMAVVELATHLLAEDHERANAILHDLLERKFQPFSRMSQSPIFDDLWDTSTLASVRDRLLGEYDRVEMVCRGIGLAKLGL